ncbi:MAG TPA: hypothetical protein VJ927_01275 [Actinomycetota bacterium]|nr:hypothetical protein [Actinomycetota bacterium]
MDGRIRSIVAAALSAAFFAAAPAAAGPPAPFQEIVEVSEIGGLGRIEVRGKIGAALQRDEGTVAVLDTSRPTSPKVVGRYDTAQDSLDGDLAFSDDGRWLFYARQTSNFDEEGVHVLDVSDPANPTLAFYLPAGGAYRVQYIKQGDAHYLVLLDAIDGLVVSRFIPETGALIPVHIDPLPALKVGGPASAGLFYEPKDPKLGVPLLYVTTGRTGLQVFDYSDPIQPVQLGAWADIGLAEVEVDATKQSRIVYAATEYWFDKAIPPEVLALDATDLGKISVHKRLSTGAAPAEETFVQGMALKGRSLYVAQSGEGLLTFDTRSGRLGRRIRQEGTRNEQSGVMGAPYAYDVEVVGGSLYLADAALGTLASIRR